MRDESFWGNVEYPTNDAAKSARDTRYKELVKMGVKGLRRWTLTNQLRPYAAFGVPDGRRGNVYKITWPREF